MGSKEYDPLEVDWKKAPQLATRFYTPAVHQAAFALPPFVQDILNKKDDDEFEV